MPLRCDDAGHLTRTLPAPGLVSGYFITSDRLTRSPQMLSCVVPFSRKRSPACFATEQARGMFVPQTGDPVAARQLAWRQSACTGSKHHHLLTSMSF
jgi:hypothetical protein